MGATSVDAVARDTAVFIGVAKGASLLQAVIRRAKVMQHKKIRSAYMILFLRIPQIDMNISSLLLGNHIIKNSIVYVSD